MWKSTGFEAALIVVEAFKIFLGAVLMRDVAVVIANERKTYCEKF